MQVLEKKQLKTKATLKEECPPACVAKLHIVAISQHTIPATIVVGDAGHSVMEKQNATTGPGSAILLHWRRHNLHKRIRHAMYLDADGPTHTQRPHTTAPAAARCAMVVTCAQSVQYIKRFFQPRIFLVHLMYLLAPPLQTMQRTQPSVS